MKTVLLILCLIICCWSCAYNRNLPRRDVQVETVVLTLINIDTVSRAGVNNHAWLYWQIETTNIIITEFVTLPHYYQVGAKEICKFPK